MIVLATRCQLMTFKCMHDFYQSGTIKKPGLSVRCYFLIPDLAFRTFKVALTKSNGPRASIQEKPDELLRKTTSIPLTLAY